MSFFITSFTIILKRIFKNPLYVCAFLTMALLIISCAFFLRAKEAITVNIGIMAREPDAVTTAATDYLTLNKEINFIIFDASQENEMTDMVKGRRLECAYIFESGVGEAIKNERFDKTVTLIITPATVASGLVNEIVFAALMNASTMSLSAKITSDMTGTDIEKLEEEFIHAINRYNAEGIFLEPVFARENTYAGGADNTFAVRILHGIFVTIIFIFSYFLIPLFIRDKSNNFLKLLSPGKRALYYLSQFMASFVCAFALCLFALLLIKVISPAALLPPRNELAAIGVYIFILQLISAALIFVMKSAEPLYAAFVFILLIHIIFGGLFFDLREVSPALGALQILPSAVYVEVLLSGILILQR